MMKNTIQKSLNRVLKETKENKEKRLIEESLVKTRFINIFESEKNIKNFNSLPKKKKMAIAWAVMEEINFLEENKILNEQLGDFLSRLFGGNALKSVAETMIEPLVNSIVSGLGLSGFFKDFLVSFLTSNPLHLVKAFKDCRVLTTLIANSLAEAVASMLMQKAGLNGGFYAFLRNALGGAVKDTAFVNKIEDFIGDIVCKTYNKLANNAGEVLKRVQTPTAAPAAA